MRKEARYDKPTQLPRKRHCRVIPQIDPFATLTPEEPMHDIYVRLIGTLVLLLVGGFLAGCSSPESQGPMPMAESPVAKYLKDIRGDELTQAVNDEFEAVEAHVASCMEANGLRYVPRAASDVGNVPGASFSYDGPTWGSREFAEAYGYGIAERPAFAGSPDSDSEGSSPDPNMAYVEALTPDEQRAYWEALYGTPSDDTPEHDRGCFGEAEEAVRGNAETPDQYWNDPDFIELMNELDALHAQIDRSAEVEALNREWRTCMTEAGFSEFTSRTSVQVPLYQEWNALHDALLNGTSDLPRDEALAAFQEREIAVALQDWECSQEVVFDERYRNIVFAAEEAFIDENRARFDALLSTYGQKD